MGKKIDYPATMTARGFEETASDIAGIKSDMAEVKIHFDRIENFLIRGFDNRVECLAEPATCGSRRPRENRVGVVETENTIEICLQLQSN